LARVVRKTPTAATLWGSQQKLKEGIILATTKVKEFLEKRRAV
jgi:hypothetical protein